MEYISDRSEEVKQEAALIEAAAFGNYETVVQLLNSGVSVDAVEHNKLLFYASKNYVTPLQLAAANGHVNCVQFLIQHGADVNAKDRYDVTALHMAAQKGHALCVKALLNAYAYPSVPTKLTKMAYYPVVPHLGGTTPLHLAASHNHVDCVKELIQYGADCNAVNKLGHTSLYLACKYGFSECVLAHLRNAYSRDILSIPSYDTGETPLHFAVSHFMKECIKELLHLGSDVNHINFVGYSPLHLALSYSIVRLADQIEVVKLLVLEGYNTDINCPDSRGFTPLHYVCFNGYRNQWIRRPEVANFLIAYGADVNIRNHQGFTLLENELKTYGLKSEIMPYIIRCMPQMPHAISLNLYHRETLDRERALSDMVARQAHMFGGNFENPEMVHSMALYRYLARHESMEISPPHIPDGLPNNTEGSPNNDDDDDDDEITVLSHTHRGFILPTQQNSISMELDERHQQHVGGLFADSDNGDNRNQPEVSNPQAWYENISSNTSPLKHLCRYVIRTCMGPKKLKHIKQLPIPDILQSYLLLVETEKKKV